MISYLSCAQERGAKDVRLRAQAALQAMTPTNLFRCGLTCDYATECLVFLRKHCDIDDPDPAQTGQLVESFCKRMHSLFVSGYVLGDAKTVQRGTLLDSPGCSVTQLVFEQIDTPEPLLVSCIGLFHMPVMFCSFWPLPLMACKDLFWLQSALPLHQSRRARHPQPHG